MNFALLIVALVLTHVYSVAGMEAGPSREKVPGCKVEKDKSNSNKLLCLDEERIQYGYLTYTYAKPWLSLEDVSVVKTYRNNGVAELLVNYLIDHIAKPKKFTYVVLHLTDMSNEHALKLYTRAQFKPKNELKTIPQAPTGLVFNMIRILK